jgi:hypothetical protein
MAAPLLFTNSVENTVSSIKALYAFFGELSDQTAQLREWGRHPTFLSYTNEITEMIITVLLFLTLRGHNSTT